MTVITQRVDIKLLLKDSPSLRPTLAEALEDVYTNARREAAQETGLDIGRFPEQALFLVTPLCGVTGLPALCAAGSKCRLAESRRSAAPRQGRGAPGDA